MLHRNDTETSSERWIHLADLDYVVKSGAAALTNTYVGLPINP